MGIWQIPALSSVFSVFPNLGNSNIKKDLKGGYLEFSNLIELENIHAAEIYMKK